MKRFNCWHFCPRVNMTAKICKNSSEKKTSNYLFLTRRRILNLAAFRIHDISVWIRIRIRGSMPLANGSGSCYFRHWPSRCQKKQLKNSFSAYYFLKVHVHHFSKISRFFFLFCLLIEGSGSGSGSIPLINGSGRIREAQKHMVDPDPDSDPDRNTGI